MRDCLEPRDEHGVHGKHRRQRLCDCAARGGGAPVRGAAALFQHPVPAVPPTTWPQWPSAQRQVRMGALSVTVCPVRPSKVRVSIGTASLSRLVFTLFITNSQKDMQRVVVQ
jgi:hypothetical protein